MASSMPSSSWPQLLVSEKPTALRSQGRGECCAKERVCSGDPRHASAGAHTRPTPTAPDCAQVKEKNMIKKLLLFTALALTTTVACNKDESKQSPNETKSAATAPDEHANTGHASADVQPGSHEDWCGEHAVPESQCTQCNSSLTAAFKATGDWCEEHGLPESQCLKCNPEIEIVRPPAATSPETKE
jgi:hypothetical protein